MNTSSMVRALVTTLALEWELGSQDPVVFCYRIGVSLRESSLEDSARAGDRVSGAGLACLP
jgi:hypothetical protein